MQSQIKMDRPICLIENTVERGKTKLVVNPEAINILSKIHEPVVVISIVGMYRTGKSYLMNRLAGAQKGFSLGSTIESETKGIWMWCVPHPIYKDRVLVLLDTEGLGDVKKGDRKYDSKIFALAVLLSSALVYNSMRTIDQDALDKIKFVGEITELIKVRTGGIEDEEGSFSRYFPIFVWAVRDFSLQLKSYGKTISADDYLEDALKLKTPESSTDNQEYNKLRNRLRMYFGKRKCFAFYMPTDFRKLQDLEQLPDDRLDEDFVAQSVHFCDYLFKNAEVKRVDITVDVTGYRLGELTKLYTEAMNSSNVACLDEVVVSLAEKENKIAIQEATKHYEDNMKKVLLPTETLSQFLDLSTQCEEEAREIFLKRSIKDKDQKFLQEFMGNVKTMKKNFSSMNAAKSREVCAALIKKQSTNFEKALAEGTFQMLGGHGKFKQGLKAIVYEYEREKGKGVKAEVVLQEFMTSKEIAEIIIIQQDNSLSQKQKEKEVENTRKQMEEMKKRVQKLEAEQENLISTAEMANLRATVQHLEKKLEEERRTIHEKLEQVFKEKERERELYLQQGLQEQAERYERQIKEIQSERKRGFFTKVGSWLDSFFF